MLTGELHEIKRHYPRNRLVVRSEQSAQIAAAFGQACTVSEDGALLLTLPGPEDKQRVMKLLAQTYDLDEMKVFEPSLNDIFVEYTREPA